MYKIKKKQLYDLQFFKLTILIQFHAIGMIIFDLYLNWNDL